MIKRRMVLNDTYCNDTKVIALLKAYEKNLHKINLIMIIISVLFLIIIELLRKQIFPLNRMPIISVINVFLAINFYYLISKKFHDNNNETLVPILLYNCDSKLYFQIFRCLNMKYRLNVSIARYYMLASVYQNNLRQLEVDIQKNRRFKNTIEYSIAIFYIAYMKQDIELLEVTYNKFLKYYNKYYGQSKYWDTLIMLIGIYI